MTRLKMLILFLFLLRGGVDLNAQQKFTISGTLRDKATGEELIGATVIVKELPNTGVLANEYGFYSLTLPQGKYTFRISFIGYQEKLEVIDLNKDTKLDWNLESGAVFKEVVITAKKQDDNLTKPAMGTETLNMNEIAKLPIIFGEKDVIKTMQLLPGIKSAGEGSTGFNVRGGATDQNLIILDEAPVYNASHLLGFFSTFNSDAIKDATIIKGNSPAQYGGRLSSVLDIKMKEGNNQDFNVNGGIGAISSRLSVEGPIQKDKSSFMISGRRTYADVFLKLTKDFKENSIYFYDFNAKANYKINDKNRVFASGYFGKDVVGLGSTFGLNYGNGTGTLRWNSILSSKLFSNTSLIYSDYDFNINLSAGGNDFNINTNIKDWNLKQDFSYFPNPNNSVRFGINAIHHTLTPSRFTGTADNSATKQSRESIEGAAYISDNMVVNKNLSLEYGLRLSTYSIMGNHTYNVYDKGRKTDSVKLATGEVGKTFVNLEPRFTANYRINEMSSLKAGYARNVQHLHLLSNSTGGSPSDQWIGNSYNIKPELADQVSLGFSRNFEGNKYEFGVETYYKNLQNQVDYKNGADINSAPDVESELLFGKGRAYGLELLLKKKTGKLTGWIGYTLSKTERQIEGINNGEWYNARQDRTHDLSVVASYQLTPRWTLAGLFVYNTGLAVTFPTGKYQLNGNTVYQYAGRNANRFPANHRMDLSATYEKQRKGRYQSSWSFGLYNAYGRENTYSVSFKDDPNDATKTVAEQTALFKWVPSVTYNFKF